jgi:hypothetical protein
MTKRNSELAESSPERARSYAPKLSTTELGEMLATKVPISTRITMAAQRELAALSREKGLPTVELLSRALNLLFESEGRHPVA